MTFKDILKKVLVWRSLILLVSIFVLFFIPVQNRFTKLGDSRHFSDVLTVWSNFDGVHYLDLAEFGYGYQHKTDQDYAFFPVYPWLIHQFGFLGSYLLSGLFLSHLFLILALYFLYLLVDHDFGSKVAGQTLFLLLIFPTSFFFGSVYAESLFLLLTVLVFYFSTKNNFFLAGLMAAIASATKITGIFLWLVVIYEFYRAYGKELKKCLNPNLIWLSLPPVGLLSYMKFQMDKINDPLYFVHIQSNFAERTTDKVIMLYQVIYRYLKMLIFTDHFTPLFFTVFLEFASACLIMYFLFFAFKKLKFTYWLFVFCSFILPSLTGTFMSLPRFTLIMFPIFIFLAQWLENSRPRTVTIYYLINALLSIVTISLFVSGYFVG